MEVRSSASSASPKVRGKGDGVGDSLLFSLRKTRFDALCDVPYTSHVGEAGRPEDEADGTLAPLAFLGVS